MHVSFATVATLIACFPAFAANNCEQLASLATPTVEISAAAVVQSGVFTPPKGKPLDGLPPFCRVAAVLHPSADSAIRIELWMPEADWNGRLEGTGNGGFAGNLAYGALAAGVKRGYAVVNTDMGMATPPGEDATVFIGRPERWKDWGYRSTHDMTVEAKRLVTAYYKRPATHNYFVGCSTGGEQAWMEAQRYPDDYDGIVGGAPANNRTGVHESILWNFISTERTPENRIPTAKLHALAAAVMNACDRLDGVADGLIGDPQKCSFDPASVECSGAENDSCLTRQQVAVVRRLYAGPVNPRTGQQIYPGLPKGSELGWDRLGPGADGQPPYAPIFTWVFGHHWNWRSFDFDRSVTAVDKKLAADVNATSLNLNAFRDHGHKLLIYHGWSDWLVPPGESVEYHDAVASETSGKDVDQFYRLFMAPGMNHCSGGVGPDHFDALSAVVAWVETGHAPDKLIASQFPADQHSGPPLRTRPLCPYPQAARYQGHGSIDDATNFFCVAPGK
ncbi:MAG: tannase/feruloyl esterase family alpha/beta hydrolase [Acidobacteriota bacterium]|nr:tannase/feruloyl esterase family alpha/beta hydrolase [Acidobacteriota bacterium]